MIYQSFLRERLDDISFLELKENKSMKIGEREFFGYLPLPLKSQNLFNIVRENINDIPIDYFLEGFIYVLALDKSHDYVDQYIEILEAYYKELEGYLMKKSLELFDKEEYQEAILYIEALINLGIKDEKVLFTLGNILENIDITDLSQEDRNKYIVDIMNIYEQILNINDGFSLAYYKLAHIYKDFGQYQKAKLALERFIKLDNNDFRIHEARNILVEIEPFYILEMAIIDIESNNLQEALNKIYSIGEENYTSLHYYYLGLVLMNLGEVEDAFDYTEKAISIEDSLIYRNQLALLFHAMGNVNEAKDELERSIEEFGDNYHLNLNLGTIYYNENNMEKALEQFNKAYEQEASIELKELIDSIK